MPLYRYQGNQHNGTPVFGTLQAESEPALRADLMARGIRLAQSHLLMFDGSLNSTPLNLPRLHQLRVGERIREAFLTGLPAHDAIRAMAAEPFQHPLLAAMPWLCLLSILSLVPATAWSLMVPGSYLPLWLLLVLTLLVLPLVWLVARYWMDIRPRSMLQDLATRIENGASEAETQQLGLPPEVKAVMRSNVNDKNKALAVADLVPTLMGSRFHQHRLLLSLIGSVAFAMVIGLGFYLLLWQIVPQFRNIFEDFGTELPILTMSIIGISKGFEAGGLFGFGACILASFGMLIFLYFAFTNGRVSEALSHVPLLGLPLRWLMQARVSRVLASMLRYNSDRSEALLAATAASTFPSVQRSGQYLSEGLRSGLGITGLSQDLTGLPLSLLAIQTANNGPGTPDWNPAGLHSQEKKSSDFTPAGAAKGTASQASPAASSPDDHRDPGWGDQRLADNFSTLAQLLEQASHGQGRFVGLILQYVITLLAAIGVGTVVIAMFLPLIKLLNDLS